MREALLEKRYGIPLILLVAILASVGIACATYVVATMNTTTDIAEPISVSETHEFSATMDPGTSNGWEFTVTNASETVNYRIRYHVTNGVADESGVSVTNFKIGIDDYLTELKGDDHVVAQGDYVIDTLDAGTHKTVLLDITVATDAPAPQTVDLEIEVGRE